MAPPRKKKTGSSLGKKRRIQTRNSRQQRRKSTAISRREHVCQPIDMPEMVYRLLNAAKHNQGRGEDTSRGFGRFRGKSWMYHSHRDSSCDGSPFRENTMSVDDSRYTKSGQTSTENLSKMEAAHSSRTSVSWNSSASDISMEPVKLASTIDNTRALLKKKSLVQVINNYIRAGIEEGKRQAKKYIRKALSFGMKSGYLIPADPEGQVIHVSPTLVDSRRSDIESRNRRRRIRKGEEEPYTDRRERRREPSPWNVKRKRHREPTPLPVIPPKKRKRSPSRNTEMRVNPVNVPPRKKPMEKKKIKGKEREKNSTLSKKKAKMTHAALSVPSKEQSRAERTRTVVKTRSKHKNELVDRRSDSKRNTKSPSVSRRRSEKDNGRKGSRRKSSSVDSVRKTDSEMNERRSNKRLRSGSSRDNIPREDVATPGNPGKEAEERIEGTNNDDNASINLD